MPMCLLYESALGYSLFPTHGVDEIGLNTESIRNSVADLNRFGKIIKLVAFYCLGLCYRCCQPVQRRLLRFTNNYLFQQHMYAEREERETELLKLSDRVGNGAVLFVQVNCGLFSFSGVWC
ncbi:snoRNP complex protein nop56 [Sarracenia purpurea var. burkii]